MIARMRLNLTVIESMKIWSVSTVWRLKWIDLSSLESVYFMTNCLLTLNSLTMKQCEPNAFRWTTVAYENLFQSIYQNFSFQPPPTLFTAAFPFLHHLNGTWSSAHVLMLILNSKVVILCHKEMNFTPTTDLTSFPIS